MDTELPEQNPWHPEKELWPIPDWVPTEAAAKFPGEEAVDLLVAVVAKYFETVELARESAIGFVNYRRRVMSEQPGYGMAI